jgi:hypothetical protein
MNREREELRAKADADIRNLHKELAETRERMQAEIDQ